MRERVTVQEQDFSADALQHELCAGPCEAGALASFVGLVRASNNDRTVVTMELEHYPGMTERSIEAILDEACERWAVLKMRVVHRVGALRPGDQIVYVGVTSPHRGDAFQACEFIMDFLKMRAPFWKKEFADGQGHWVDARVSDAEAAQRWHSS